MVQTRRMTGVVCVHVLKCYLPCNLIALMLPDTDEQNPIA